MSEHTQDDKPHDIDDRHQRLINVVGAEGGEGGDYNDEAADAPQPVRKTSYAFARQGRGAGLRLFGRKDQDAQVDRD